MVTYPDWYASSAEPGNAAGYEANRYRITWDKDDLVGSDDETDLVPQVAPVAAPPVVPLVDEFTGLSFADFDKADGYAANGYRIPLDKEELVGSDDEADLGPKVAWLNQLHKMNVRAAPFVPAQ